MDVPSCGKFLRIFQQSYEIVSSVETDNQTTISGGQTLSLVCRYDSSDRVGVTVGGAATTNEMCLATIFYVPASRSGDIVELQMCSYWRMSI